MLNRINLTSSYNAIQTAAAADLAGNEQDLQHLHNTSVTPAELYTRRSVTNGNQVKVNDNQVKVNNNQVKVNIVKVIGQQIKVNENQVKVNDNQVKVNKVKVIGQQITVEKKPVKRAQMHNTYDHLRVVTDSK